MRTVKVYTIIGGVNGVGKSSLTGALQGSGFELGQVIDVDRLTAQLGGNPLTGGRAALEQIRACLARNVSFTQETTLSGHLTRKTILRAKEQGYWVRLYYVGLDSLSESLDRIENRVRRGGHDIPRQDVEWRYAARWETVKAVLPLCDEGNFFDNNNGFVQVAEYRSGSLRPLGDLRPAWLTELLAALGT